jgi:DNA polymerase III alpha subunit
MDSGMLKTYINRKCGKESVEYLHPDLEDILKETYGIILYQEQIMSIASKLGGYSLGEADMLRRAIGKKKPEELARLTEELKGRMLENSISDDVATSIINSIITFGDYGFNKSHAAAYAYTAFQTAYLKAHHRANFVCQLLNSEIGNLEKTAEYVDKSGIQIFPVSLTKSNCLWSVEDGGVRIGFSAIKGINLESCVNVDDIDAFCKANKLHKGKIEALGKAMSNNPHMQRDVLGFSLLNILDEYDISLCEKRNDIIGGEVTRVKPHTTKFGKPMSFITIKDRTDTHSLVLFNGDEIEVGEVYLAQVSGSKILKISKAPRKT